ncbi:LytR/AlgR family response regulator transcription factor [Massilia sp. S19_KUP03_FR1]|uniref:LytR/AlgR family response regulator transcription factor n=1 Tax=Massilia sp. S19_KUP03_FR1 TaxID=3025503 RepID=UPI002FCDDF89
MATVRRRVLIVDDEEPGRINLRFALAAHPSWSIAGECADAAQARAFLAIHPVDLLFLDIRMPRESGLELAHELAHQPAPPLIIFVTAYDTHAVEAFRVHALDYLLKPLDDADLARALVRADALMAQRQLAAPACALRDWSALRQRAPGQVPAYLRQFNVRSVGRIDFIELADVAWIEAAGNYVELHLAQRNVLHRVPIGTLERHLDPALFVRVHRSALVRLGQVVTLRTSPDGASALTLRCGSVVPVSERHLAKVRRLLSMH